MIRGRIRYFWKGNKISSEEVLFKVQNVRLDEKNKLVIKEKKVKV